MDTAYGYGKTHPQIAVNKVQETLHFRYLKWLVIKGPILTPPTWMSRTGFVRISGLYIYIYILFICR